MPEIPDLEAIRGFFNERLPGQEITRADVFIPHVVRTGAEEFRKTLPGDVFGETHRHGKFLLLTLASGRVLAVNAMLTGRWQYFDAKEKKHGKTAFVIAVGDGKELRYADQRVMGKAYLVPVAEMSRIPGWDENGPDLLDPALTEDVWVQRLKKYRGRIKSILTNAEFVQGMGNAYSDEILWEARINPFTQRTALSEEDQRALFRAAGEVMAWATPMVRDRMIVGDRLDYEERRDFMRVHNLGGRPCPRCGTPVTEISEGKRNTDFCRTCQPGGPMVGR